MMMMFRYSILVGVLLAGPAAAELRTGPYRHAYCYMYEHRDMTGARMRMPNGDRVSMASGDVGSTAWRERPDWNDVVSSATVDPGCTLRVWEHIEAQGAARTWHGGANGWRVNYVGSAWNDRISSATCYCR